MKHLKAYSELRLALQEFRIKHQPVFAQFEAMQAELSVAESALKEEVREAGRNVETDTLAIIYRPKFHEFYDYKTISKIAKPAEKALIDQKAVSVEVDKKKFQELVKSGAISMEVERKSFKREELTPSIIIKDKESDNAEAQN